jgi:hypothetical protein
LWHFLAIFDAENTIPRLQTMRSAAFPWRAGFVKSLAAGMGRTPGKIGAKHSKTFIAAKCLPGMTKCRN